MEEEGDVATAFTMARILSNIPVSRGGPTSVVIYDIHALQERFYFGDHVLPLFETGMPLLKQRLHQLPDADNVVIAFPDDGAWKRFHKQLDHFPTAILFVIVRPFSKNGYRRLNRMVAELLWIELVWIVDWWAGVKVQLYTDPETLKMMGKEHALILANRRSDIDWLIGWVFAQRSGCLGSALAIMKKSSKFLPVIGWPMWFSEYLFLERSWAKDENTLKVGLQRLKDYPQPFWLALFAEGTRFTQVKLLAAQEYASSNGLPVPRNVLIPRTKGFVTSVSQMRTFVPAIYDMTVAIPRSTTPPTMLRLFKGQPSVIHVKVKRHLMKDLPETDEAVAQWCKDLYIVKDDLLDKHKAADSFPDSEPHDIGRPIKSLVVVSAWACLLVYMTFKFLRWSNLFSSWKGLAITAVCLAIVTVLMQILIQSSQSERSTPAKVAPSKTSNDGESSRNVHDKKQ